VPVGENQGACDTLPSGRPKRAAVDKGINRLHMDPNGKTYTEFQQKQFAIKHQRRKKHVQLFMQKKKILSKSNDIYMKKAVDVIFTQMSAKKASKPLEKEQWLQWSKNSNNWMKALSQASQLWDQPIQKP
jgi:hypothetical protein